MPSRVSEREKALSVRERQLRAAQMREGQFLADLIDGRLRIRWAVGAELDQLRAERRAFNGGGVPVKVPKGYSLRDKR
jgi:hypothetical protein